MLSSTLERLLVITLSALLSIAFFGTLVEFNAPDPPSPNALPRVIPTISDPDAPNAQDCPGYKASNVVETDGGLTADLTIAGIGCHAFGIDISELSLEISYQAKERLNVKIQPKYIAAANSSCFVLGDEFVPLPSKDGRTTKSNSDLLFTWSNEPAFQFAISRRQDEKKLFSTFGHVVVYENQFIELVTNMEPDYNIYGLAENIHNFRLGTDYTQTLFNADTPNVVDGNSYSTHPFYQETRYRDGHNSTAHGVYARNAHAQEWLMREKTLTYRAIGGSFDFYFLSGQQADEMQNSTSTSSALEVFRQYQHGCVGLPAMQRYWAFGFHQCHWGWTSIRDLLNVVSNYAAVGIPLESIWNDIDLYDRYRPFTNNLIGYPTQEMHEFVEHLHSRGQYYVAIQDSNVYFPNPSNTSDVESYPPFGRGADMDVFIRDRGTGYFYIGENWPGYGVWADWLSPNAQRYWTDEMTRFHELVPFDGVWIDLNEVSSGCAFSCGNVELNSSGLTVHREPSKNLATDNRKLNFPPYRINNAKSSKQIIEETIALDAFHNDEYATSEYDVHNLWSLGMAKATYNATTSIIPGKRPFIVSRSTFAGSGQYVGHWGGDNEAKWGAMFLSISQAFAFQMSGIPMFGVDTCGFAGNTTEELCARWMELSAFFPFFRNHYENGNRPQEAYVWPSVAEASRRAISTRYSLLTYIYTLFYYAHTKGDTVMRALAWEFPNDESLRATDMQFLLGPSLLVTPVLLPGTTTVKGVFPGIGQGTRWYDWHSMQEVKNAKPQENITMEAPLEHINLHVRGGSILPLQSPGNTTTATRKNPYSLIVALDTRDSAVGSLYLDDGESLHPNETRKVEFSYVREQLTIRTSGSYHATAPLANVTFLGLRKEPMRVNLHVGGRSTTQLDIDHGHGFAKIGGLERETTNGAWELDMDLQLTL